ncbi:MAG: hypothetical protein PHO89_01265 [Methylacidiphilaceae bacterium]|nr:hypothetical protein [Candidatus Methylacidiphilaceae bacterium]
MSRPVRPTGASDDSSGKTWGLSGEGVILVAFAIIGSIWFVMTLRSGLHWSWGASCGVGISPTILTIAWWLIFKEGKRKSYQWDVYEAFLGGDFWTRQPELRPRQRLRPMWTVDEEKK